MQIQSSRPETIEPMGSAGETLRYMFRSYLLEVTLSTPPNNLGLETTRTFSGYYGNQEPGRLNWPGPLERRDGGTGLLGLWRAVAQFARLHLL